MTHLVEKVEEHSVNGNRICKGPVAPREHDKKESGWCG